ncbi:CLUMA_CG019590, isoform A [Clunio marinus]|uniref:CLUMA_CG019590, isoform A n=1 Tax=Clunio marinus TaxID=568069 RepID=A0A1J1J5E6_9DIPT|nr:CLUMA_CG019590, isoform A [Clunio marinus]
MSLNKDLLLAFEQRNFGKFQELLQVYLADPNYYIKEEEQTIFETILSSPNSENYIKLCIENGGDFYQKNSNDYYPLHRVIESHCLENLKQVEILFDDLNSDMDDDTYKRYSPYVNVNMTHGQNSLHILAEALTNDNYQTIFEMMKILISHGCNVNYPNYDGKTAFHILLEKLQQLKTQPRKEILEYFLKYADVDFYSHKSDEIIEMVMNQKLKYELPARQDIKADYETMTNLLNTNQINTFETLFPLFKSSCEDSEIYADRCASFMQIAVQKSLINIVDLLIDYSIDVNKTPKNCEDKTPPVFKAFSNANPAILRVFFLHPKIRFTYDNEGERKTLLHQYFDSFKGHSYATFRRNESAREMTRDQKKCFDLLMDHPKCNRHLINAYDEAGLPAIYYSVRYKNDYITIALLKRGAYVGTVINGIRKSVLEEFLDSTITTNDRFSDDEDLEIKIDYSFLTPPFKEPSSKKRSKKPKSKETSIAISNDSNPNEKLKMIPSVEKEEIYLEEMKPLKKIAESSELQKFIVHPTIASFILLKWYKLSFLIYTNLILILLFMMAFIPFSVICQTYPVHTEVTYIAYLVFQVLSLISLCTLLVRETCQALLSLRQYVSNVSNWIDILLVASALTVLIFESQIPHHLSRVLRTIVILLAAAEYFNLLGMVPMLKVSIYTKMYLRVMNTFIKSLAFYSMMLLAFAFSFFTLMGDKFAKDIMKLNREGPDTTTNDIPVTNATRNERYNNFYTVGSSIIKSFVMLTGELETSYIHTEGWTYAILFLLFLFLVTIVLNNLLNALAVSDTQEIKRDAKLIDLNQRIEAMCDNEAAIFKKNSRMGNWLKMVISMFPKTLPDGCIIIKPNRSYRIYVKQSEQILLNDWLQTNIKLFKPDVKFNADIMKEIQKLLTTKREEKTIMAIRMLKENRNEKLANDIIKISEMLNDIQKNVTKLQADVYNLRKRSNL